jgi:hypothetical protein
MVPPGLVASPFFSAEPAVSAPWVLASFVDGIELVDPPLAPVVLGEPPVDGVRCVVSLLGVVAAGPPDVELPPADEPLLCATARELARVKAAANKYVVRCIRFPPIEGRL